MRDSPAHWVNIDPFTEETMHPSPEGNYQWIIDEIPSYKYTYVEGLQYTGRSSSPLGEH